MYNFLFIILYCLMMATLTQPKHVAVMCKNICYLFEWLSQFLYDLNIKGMAHLKVVIDQVAHPHKVSKH
jgi:hypothetical protein